MNTPADTALIDAPATETTDPATTDAANPSQARIRRASLRKSDGGFTLVEVMVVVLIIGILLAIGVPTFLGARDRANDRAAQASLRTAQNTALIIFTDRANFYDAHVGNLRVAEPQLTWYWGTTASTGPNNVSVNHPNPVPGDEWGAASMSKSGTCFYVHLRSNGSTQFGESDTTACTGANAMSVTGTGW